MDVLNAMELVAVGKNEKPVKEIKMKAVTVFVDPYEEFQKKLQEKAEKARKAAIKNEEVKDISFMKL